MPLGKKIRFIAPIRESFINKENASLFFIEGTAINATETRNGITYIADELSKSAESLNGKPLLKDHNNSVDSIVGRIRESGFSDNAVKFKAQVMDAKMREMISDGRITNVSIGASVRTMDEEKVGESVKRIARGLEFLELSLVAVPGDPGATISQALEEAFMVEKMKCPECGKEMDNKEEMQKHMSAKHPEEEKMAEPVKQEDSKILELLQKMSEKLDAQEKVITALKAEDEKEDKAEEKGRVAKEQVAEEKSNLSYMRESDSGDGFWTCKIDPISRKILI